MTNSKRRPGLGHNRQKKTDKERAKTYHQRKLEAGYRKIWVDPATLGRIDYLGSIDEVSANYARLEREAREQSDKIIKIENEIERGVELNRKLVEITNKQDKAKQEKIDELKEREQELVEKNAELKQLTQKREDMIADQASALNRVREELEAERNRSLFNRLISLVVKK